MAFLFVDRIRQIEPGKRLCGELDVAPGVAVPGWLIAEAVGQLAGWAAMALMDFRSRPVASRAGEVQVAFPGEEGALLAVNVEIDRCEQSRVVYRGWAELDGRRVGSLDRCVGPMLAMEMFDDPLAVRSYHERLCDGGVGQRLEAESIAADLPIATVGGMRGESLLARVHVPLSAPFFADHFPRWPVFPATLLLDVQARVALRLAAEVLRCDAGRGPRLVRVRDVKMRAFTSPGQTLDILARLRSRAGDGTIVSVLAESDGKRVATANVEAGAV
jgi:3-hydroxymyristoyl/3-hydroxydecanoyl-(acyl carrier protein) dehydratase